MILNLDGIELLPLDKIELDRWKSFSLSRSVLRILSTNSDGLLWRLPKCENIIFISEEIYPR